MPIEEQDIIKAQEISRFELCGLEDSACIMELETTKTYKVWLDTQVVLDAGNILLRAENDLFNPLFVHFLGTDKSRKFKTYLMRFDLNMHTSGIDAVLEVRQKNKPLEITVKSAE